MAPFGHNLNLRPSGYEPDECPTVRPRVAVETARQDKPLCSFALDLGLVVLSSVAEMLFADSMLRIDFELSLLSH